jgi:hypothetical protein
MIKENTVSKRMTLRSEGACPITWGPRAEHKGFAILGVHQDWRIHLEVEFAGMLTVEPCLHCACRRATVKTFDIAIVTGLSLDIDPRVSTPPLNTVTIWRIDRIQLRHLVK